MSDLIELKESFDKKKNVLLQSYGNVDFSVLTLEELEEKMRVILISLKDFSLQSRVDGKTIEPFILRNSITSDDISISIRTRLKSERSFKTTFKAYFSRKDFLAGFIDSFFNAVMNYIKDGIAYEACSKLTEEFDSLCEEAGLSFRIHFISGYNGIAMISDKEITLSMEPETIFELSNLPIFNGNSKDEYEQLCYNRARTSYINELAGIQTPVHFLASKSTVLSKFKPTTRMRVSKQIRTIIHRNVDTINSIKSGYAYYSKDDVFAVVYKNEDGTIESVLSPFNVITNERLNIDIVKEIAAV